MYISPEIPQNKKKNGARDQDMEKQTVELLKECNSGCKMGINSMNQVREYVMDEKLAKVLKEYDEKHKKLEKETSKLLAEFGKDEKEPEKIATAFSWISTEMKLMIKDDASQIAKIMTDGCNMGIKSLTEKINQYSDASKESISLAKDIVKCEEAFRDDLKQFL